MPSTGSASVSPAGRTLSGLRVLVTRPDGQADKLLSGIRALGGDADHIPFLAIEPIADSGALAQMADRLPTYRACIFISANAVTCALPALTPRGWPASVAGAAVGPGTAALLRACGVAEVVMPECQFDSEGLLSEPFFNEVSCQGHAFALIRGEGGRDVLAKTLRARGARVDELAVYRRTMNPQALALLTDWLDAAPSSPRLMVISSSESLQNVMAAAAPAQADVLRRIPLLVPHPKIAEAAHVLGFAKVMVSNGGDEGLLETLRSYNGVSQSTSS